MGMMVKRGLIMRLMRGAQAHAHRASSSETSLQRGAAAFSSVREYVSPALTSPPDGFSRTELRVGGSSLVGLYPVGGSSVVKYSHHLRESIVARRRPVWQEWSRGYADSSVEKDDAPQVNVEYLEFGTHKTRTAKRFAVGTTALDVDELQDNQVVDKETKEKAKKILQQVSEKMGETVEEAKLRQLQEKLAATEGIGEVVQDLYNQHEEHNEYSQNEAGVKA